MIQIKSLSVGARLLPLSFELKQGQVTHVIGPNGSGKSTLLEAISGVGDVQHLADFVQSCVDFNIKAV